MDSEWDITIYDRFHQLALVVEVKNKRNATPEWAARLLRNILAHGTYPNAPYFLIAFPDRFYVWKHTNADQAAIEPSYSIDAQPILHPYFDQSGVNPEHVSSQSLELILAAWLSDLMHTSQDDLDPTQAWLIESGFHAAIAGGSLDQAVVV